MVFAKGDPAGFGMGDRPKRAPAQQPELAKQAPRKAAPVVADFLRRDVLRGDSLRADNWKVACEMADPLRADTLKAVCAQALPATADGRQTQTALAKLAPVKTARAGICFWARQFDAESFWLE